MAKPTKSGFYWFFKGGLDPRWTVAEVDVGATLMPVYWTIDSAEVSNVADTFDDNWGGEIIPPVEVEHDPH